MSTFAQRQRLQHLNSDQGEQYIHQSTGYSSDHLVGLLRLSQRLQDGGKITEADMRLLTEAHPAIPVEMIRERVEAVNATPAGENRLRSFIGEVTRGGDASMESSLALVADFTRHSTAGEIAQRLDDRQQAVDQGYGRKPEVTRSENREPTLRNDLQRAMFAGQQMPSEGEMADRLATTIDSTRERLQADRDGDSDRSLRDVVADSFHMHEASSTAVDLGLAEDPT